MHDVDEYNLGILRGCWLPHQSSCDSIRLHYSCGVDFGSFPKKDNSQVVDVKYIFKGSCIQCEISKHG